MFHAKQWAPIRAYRSWRHTRHVRFWRAFFEDRRYWDRLAGEITRNAYQPRAARYDSLAQDLRKAVTGEPR